MKDKLHLKPLEPASSNLEEDVLATGLYNWLIDLTATGKQIKVDHLTDEDDWREDHRTTTKHTYDTPEGRLALYVRDGQRITTARIDTPTHQRRVCFSNTGHIQEIRFQRTENKRTPYTRFLMERQHNGNILTAFACTTIMDFEGQADQSVCLDGRYDPHPICPDQLVCQSLLLDDRPIHTCGMPKEINNQGHVVVWDGGKEEEYGLGYYPSARVIGATEVRITGGRTTHTISIPETVPNFENTVAMFTNATATQALLEQATCQAQTDLGRGRTKTIKIY